MNRTGLTKCLEVYASPDSANLSSGEFVRALNLHLEGSQTAAIAILQELSTRYALVAKAEERNEVEHLLILSEVARGSLNQAEQRARGLLSHAQGTNNERWHGLALYALAAVNHQQGHAAYAADLARESRHILLSGGSRIDVARASYILGESLLLHGDIAAATDELRSAISLAGLGDEPLTGAMARRSLALCLQKQGLYCEAERAYRDAVQVYLELGAERRVAQAKYGLAVLLIRKGNLSGARAVTQDVSHYYGAGVTSVGHARFLVLVGWLDVLEGEPSRALECLRQALETFRGAQAQRDEALCHEFIGDALAVGGDWESAHGAYLDGITAGRQVSEHSDVVVECLRKDGELLSRTSKLPEALAAARLAGHLTGAYRDQLEIAALCRLRGLIKIAHGRCARGLEFLQRAWVLFERMGAMLEAHITAQIIGDHLAGDGRGAEATVWRQLGGSSELPSLKLFLPRKLKSARAVSASAKGLEDLAAQAAEQGIITRDPRVLKAFDITMRGAPAHLPLLIFGETGTGKELLAAAAHRFSGRTGEFVPINCAALPPDLLDAELFGHTRGAYTGALRDRPGLIEAASGGTLFLDEIGEMSLPVQGRLLRAIELGEIRRLGENKPRHVNTRFVGATHRDLQDMVRQGTYRPDLFFRLRGLVAVIPPLRERPWDVDLLVDHFLTLVRRAGGPELRVSQAARERLRAHPWPGNVRELKSIVERLATMPPDEGLVEVDDLGLDPIRVAGSLEEHLEDEERKRLVATLESVQWNRSRAARILRVKRTTLLGKMRRLGIIPPS